jgi:hypothetical protein
MTEENPDADGSSKNTRRKFLRDLVAVPCAIPIAALAGVTGEGAGAFGSEAIYTRNHPAPQRHDEEMHKRALTAAEKANADSRNTLSVREIIDAYRNDLKAQEKGFKKENSAYEDKKESARAHGVEIGLPLGMAAGVALVASMVEKEDAVPKSQVKKIEERRDAPPSDAREV